MICRGRTICASVFVKRLLHPLRASPQPSYVGWFYNGRTDRASLQEPSGCVPTEAVQVRPHVALLLVVGWRKFNAGSLQ